MKYLLLFPLLIAFGLVQAQRGSGVLTTEERDVSDFTEIEISSVVQAKISYGANYAVTIEADDNIIGRVETKVWGGRLTVGLDGNSNVEDITIRATIVLPKLNAFRASGAARAEVAGFDQAGEELEIRVSGAASTNFARGRYDRLDVRASGAAKLDADDLKVNEIKIEAAGASRVRYGQAQSGSVERSGAASVREG